MWYHSETLRLVQLVRTYPFLSDQPCSKELLHQTRRTWKRFVIENLQQVIDLFGSAPRRGICNVADTWYSLEPVESRAIGFQRIVCSSQGFHGGAGAEPFDKRKTSCLIVNPPYRSTVAKSGRQVKTNGNIFFFCSCAARIVTIVAVFIPELRY